ncbi:hypothetical protein F3D3_4763 [Fusibacter sp. 3D3]|nr:hypothetical protein F3D3_4763 [Fusibacter sp. 3D3]
MLISASNQVSLFDLDAEVDELTSCKSDQLFSLFNQFTNMDDIIPAAFYNTYYSDVGKNRDFPLEGMLKSLVFYNLIGLPTFSTLICIINISSDFINSVLNTLKIASATALSYGQPFLLNDLDVKSLY